MIKRGFSIGLVCAAFAVAQSGAPPVAPDDSIKLGDVAFTASFRSRVYVWDWFQPAGTYQNQYTYSGNLLRLNFAGKHGAFDYDAEIAEPILAGLPDNATAPAPQGALGLGSNYYASNGNNRYSAMAFPKQLYGRYHFGGGEPQIIQVGRFEFNDGTELTPKNLTLAAVKRDHISQRLIGTFGFSDVGRSFDGLRYSWTQGSEDFTFVAATPTRGVFQTDGWGWNRIGFGYAAFTKDWGHGNHLADTRFFAIDYDDFRHILKTDNRSTAVRKGDTENIHIQTWGAHSVHVFTTTAGIFDALGWFAAQTGRWGTQTQRSYALDFGGGYQFSRILPALKPWLRGGYTMGSGDSNASDSTHQTFFQILPTPRTYARFPFFNMMNTEDAYGSLILRPHPKVTITSEYHSLRLTNANDLWYSGGGAYQPWTFGYTGRAVSGRRSLANLYDTSVEYRFNRHATFTAYLGYAQGLAVMDQIYPSGKDARFGYLEALFRL